MPKRKRWHEIIDEKSMNVHENNAHGSVLGTGSDSRASAPLWARERGG